MANFQEKADFIWGLADMLRGDYLRREYPDVILPMVVIRRLDLAMAATREAVRQAYEKYKGKLENLHGVLTTAAGDSLVYNTSDYDWDLLLKDPNNLAQNLINYLNGFSPDVQDIIEKFDFRRQVARLQSSKLLHPIFKRFDGIQFLNPEVTDNHEMGQIFEHLIYRFNTDNNEFAGEHVTPREVIRLMVRLLLLEDEEALTNPNAIITIYDPACGTGGMLTEAKNYICQKDRNPNARVELFGQKINPTSYAVAKSDFLLKGEDPQKLIFGNSFSEDGHEKRRFRHMLSNPPFGVDWRKVEYINNKRNEITDAQIDEIAQIYHAFEPGDYCRVFDNEDFGYRRIRVERPLRLNFAVTPERIKRLHEQKAFVGLTDSKKKSEVEQEADR